MKHFLASALLLTCIAVSSFAQSNNVINNDTFWKTKTGSYIYSQGGGIFRFPDAQGKEHYYWYGVKYQEAVDYCPKALGGSNSNNTHFLSVTCYRSDDLVNWTFVRDVITSSSAGWAYWVGRLGVAYVEEAKKYALFVQFNDNVGVFTCNTPFGNYTKHNQIDMTSMIGTPNTGDQTVFTDPDTGKSYLCYSYGKGRSRIYLSEIGVCANGKIGLKDCHEIYKGSGREGDCMFKYKNKYYVCASDLYGWNASNVYYLEASSIYGPYTPTNSMLKMPGADADYGHVTQTGFFYTVRGTKQETVIYCGDRWAGFAGNGNGFNQWCPVSFVNNKPYFNSLSQWHLDAETGEWWVGQDNNYVKNFSFDADRVNIPSANKPSQAYLRGWTTTVMKGNKVVIGDANSPVLNGKNSKEDRAKVMGNFCMNISDKTDFKRKVSQVIKSTIDVPLPDGSYTLSCYVKNSATFKKAYPNAEPKEMTYVDTGFRAGAVRQAAAKAAQGGAPAYLYLFTWKPASNALGASHGMELPFMLHNVSLQREMTGASPAAYKFEKLISSIWLSFIKTGNPNTKGLPRWEPYNEETGVTMILDNKCEPRQHHDRELMQMSRSIW